jgi:hypothetical protein
LYAKRKTYTGKKDEESIFFALSYKLLMNSLYGKFAEEVESYGMFCEGQVMEMKLKEK